MKELDALLEALNKNGIVERMQGAANVVAKLDPEMFEKSHDNVVKSTLTAVFHTDEEICDLFATYCFAVGMDSLVKELNIKSDPNYEPDKKERLAMLFAKVIAE